MKKYDKILFLTRSKLNSLAKALIYLNISHNEFVLTNNVSKESDDIKEEIKNSNDETVSFYCLKCRKNMESKNIKIVKTKMEE